MRVEVVAHRAHDRVAQEHRVAHALAAQVEHAVAQAQHLVDRAVLVDRERRRRRPPRAARRAATSSSISPVGEVRVDVALLAPHDLPGGGDDVLGAQPLGDGVRVARPSRDGRRAGRGPVRSRRSMKISPPWSRRRCTQPATRTRLADARRRRARRPGVAVVVRARRPHSAAPRDVVHDACPASTVLLLSRLHVLQRGALVAEDGNVAGARPVGLLELALERAARRVRVSPLRPARRTSAASRNAAACVLRRARRRRTGRAAARPPAASRSAVMQDPLDAARPADAGRVRPADLLDQPVVAAAAADAGLRAERVGGELEHGARVVVEPAHERVVDLVGLADAVEQRAHGLRSARGRRRRAARAGAARRPSPAACRGGRSRTRAAG